MPLVGTEVWTERVREILRFYDEDLLRRVSGNLSNLSSRWSTEELIERFLSTIDNAVIIDRRFEVLPERSRQLLAVIARSRQPRWRLGPLLEILSAHGSVEGLTPVAVLMQEGLLFPDLPPEHGAFRGFEDWLGPAGALASSVVSHPSIMARALREPLPFPELRGDAPPAPRPEADGLDWPLRLAVLWQQVAGTTLRRTQQGGFFKRDADRLRTDPLLNGAFDGATDIPDAGVLAVTLARLEGILLEADGEVKPGAFPDSWKDGTGPALVSLWSALLQADDWNPISGWIGPGDDNPWPATYVLAVLLLLRLPESSWADVEAIDEWIVTHHPRWGGSFARKGARKDAPAPASAFILGLACSLRIVQTGESADHRPVARLTPLGRWMLGERNDPLLGLSYPQTLLVQPNLEIIVYRQGLTPTMIQALGRFAAWESLGAACTLRLHPESVYRGLESGLSFESILQLLEQHGMKPVPHAVVESLRTWSNKRDRLTVYLSGALFEFSSPADLERALGRGLPAVRLSDRLALVPSENGVDYRHFRLTGTRDYRLPPDQCVEVAADGVTLIVDPVRSDLLLETELGRFAEPLNRDSLSEKPQYRLTVDSLKAFREAGHAGEGLEEWFVHRTGRPLSPAARLLLSGAKVPPLALRRHLVLSVPTPEIAEGLLQWPATQALIHARLGPTALVIAGANLDALKELVKTLGIQMVTELE